MPGDNEYRLLTLADVEQAAGVMSQAYQDDPLVNFMLPKQRSRIKTLYKFFHIIGEFSIKNQRVYGTGNPLQGVAYWQFPGQADLSISLKSLAKLVPLLFTSYTTGYLRARAVTSQIDVLHKKYAPEAHFYLDNLGVLPSARGKGLSSRLLRPVLAMADAQKTIAYTDTVTEANVAFYEHFGFECLEACPVQGTGLIVWGLLRTPRYTYTPDHNAQPAPFSRCARPL